MGDVCFISKGWQETKGIRNTRGRARTLRFPVAPRKYCGFLRYVREAKLVAGHHCPLKRQADRHFRKYVSAANGKHTRPCKFSSEIVPRLVYSVYKPLDSTSGFSSSLSRARAREIFDSCRLCVDNDIGYGRNDGVFPVIKTFLANFPRPRFPRDGYRFLSRLLHKRSIIHPTLSSSRKLTDRPVRSTFASMETEIRVCKHGVRFDFDEFEDEHDGRYERKNSRSDGTREAAEGLEKGVT